MTLPAGPLNQRITFQRPTTALDEFGQAVPGGHEDVATVWAAIRPMGSSERLAAAQMQSGQTHVVTVRYSAALAAATGAWRIVHGGRLFGIVGLPRNLREARVALVFDCTERRDG